MKKSQTFQTPTKRKPTDTGSFDGPFDPNWDFMPHKRVLPDNNDDMDSAIETGEITLPVLTNMVQDIESSLQMTGITVEELAVDTKSRLKLVESDLRLTAQKQIGFQAYIGNTPILSQKYTAPALWGTIVLMKDELQHLENDSEAEDIKRVLTLLQEWPKDCKSLGSEDQGAGIGNRSCESRGGPSSGIGSRSMRIL
jgi:hypothetical protein